MDNEDYHTFESSLSKEGLIYMDVAASGVKRYINILQKIFLKYLSKIISDQFLTYRLIFSAI